MKSRLAIIPARGGSKRIPNKNIKSFCGVPMLERTLRLVSGVGLFSDIHVSTDSEDVYSLASSCGHQPLFMRPASLADDHSALAEVTRFVLSRYSVLSNRSFDEVWLILPCSPFLVKEDLISIAELLRIHQDPVMTMARYCAPIQWAHRISNEGLVKPVYPDQLAARSQDLEDMFYETGNIVAYPHLSICNDMDASYRPHLIPKHRAIDIDDNEDWAKAESLYKVLESK